MRQYLDLLKRVISTGDMQYNSRTGQLMLVSAGDQSVYDLREGFPVCTTKASAPFRWVAEELFWMLRGETSAKTLFDKGPNIWNRNTFQHHLKRQGLESKFPKNTPDWEEAFEEYQERMSEPGFDPQDADLGPVYGFQFRHFGARYGRLHDNSLLHFLKWAAMGFGNIKASQIDYSGRGVDQVRSLITGIRKDPGSRYHILTAWNPSDLKKMALAPCHVMAQFTVTNDRDLDLHMFQRSCDVYLGVPFNIAQYALLLSLVAKETGLQARKFIHSYGNVHVYCGVPPRSNFLKESTNLAELQRCVSDASSPADYLAIREEYLAKAPAEGVGDDRADHMPFALMQLSKEPYQFPNLRFVKNLSFFEAIEQPTNNIVMLEGYKAHKWDSKAKMAA